MSIERIREAVLSNAKKEAKNIIELAMKNSNSLYEKKKREIEDEYERYYKNRIQEISEEYTRRLIQFKGSTNKKILEKRNALIDKIMDKAKEKVLNLPEEKYMELMERLIEKVTVNTKGALQVHKDEKDIFIKIIEGINKKRDEKTQIKLDETKFLHERGGFIFVTEDYEVNQTLELLLNDLKKELLPVLAKELFKDMA